MIVLYCVLAYIAIGFLVGTAAFRVLGPPDMRSDRVPLFVICMMFWPFLIAIATAYYPGLAFVRYVHYISDRSE